MRLIDADKIDYTVASVYWGKDEDGKDIYRRTAIATESEIDNAPTIDADAYFDAVDRIKACPNCRYTHIHKMFSENGQTPWISVEDKLPINAGDVLVYMPEKIDKIMMYYYCGNDEWETEDRWLGKTKSFGITHWMRLPMGPEEV